MKTGDTTYFYIDRGKNEKDKKFINYIQTQPSRESAWQIYLLYRSETMMPVFWHGAYKSRLYIFDEADLNGINPLKCYDVSILSDSNLLLPDVKMSYNQETADVFCTFWNSWDGLVREHIRITFNPDKTVGIEELEPLILFNYKSNILL